MLAQTLFIITLWLGVSANKEPEYDKVLSSKDILDMSDPAKGFGSEGSPESFDEPNFSGKNSDRELAIAAPSYNSTPFEILKAKRDLCYRLA